MAERALAGVDDLYEELDAIEPGAGLTLRVVRGTDERDVAVAFDRDAQEAAT